MRDRDWNRAFDMHAVDILWPVRDHGPRRLLRMRRGPRTGCTSGRIILSRSDQPRNRPARSRRRKRRTGVYIAHQRAFPDHPLRTRDLTRLLAGTARSMRGWKKSPGRSDDIDHPARASMCPHADRGSPDGRHPDSPAFPDRAEQNWTGMDQMRRAVRMCRSHRWRDFAREAAAQQLARRSKRPWAFSVQIDVGDVNSITASEGKAVRNHRQPPQRLAAAARLQNPSGRARHHASI